MIQKSYDVFKLFSFKEIDFKNISIYVVFNFDIFVVSREKRIFKVSLYVLVNGLMSYSVFGNSLQFTTVRREFRQIRDRVIQLLDQLEVGENVIFSFVDSKRVFVNKGQ